MKDQVYSPRPNHYFNAEEFSDDLFTPCCNHRIAQHVNYFYIDVTGKGELKCSHCHTPYGPVKYFNSDVSKIEADKRWDDFWRDICTNPDGSINLDQIKKELHDSHMLMHINTKLVSYLSSEVLSYPNYEPQVLIDMHKANVKRQQEDWLEEELSVRGYSVSDEPGT